MTRQTKTTKPTMRLKKDKPRPLDAEFRQMFEFRHHPAELVAAQTPLRPMRSMRRGFGG